MDDPRRIVAVELVKSVPKQRCGAKHGLAEFDRQGKIADGGAFKRTPEETLANRFRSSYPLLGIINGVAVFADVLSFHGFTLHENRRS